MYQLLPYVEQQGLYNLCQQDFHANVGNLVALYYCPSDGRGDVSGTGQTTLGLTKSGLTWYAGVTGSTYNPDGTVPAGSGGVFEPGVRVRVTDIADGTSNTLMMGLVVLLRLRRPAGHAKLPVGLPELHTAGSVLAGQAGGELLDHQVLQPAHRGRELGVRRRLGPVPVVQRPGRDHPPRHPIGRRSRVRLLTAQTHWRKPKCGPDGRN
jgi:hypothetical protein